MIVIIDDRLVNAKLFPGDTITVEFTDAKKKKTILHHAEVVNPIHIKRIVCFAFADEDGTVTSKNVSYTLCDELPPELKGAVGVKDLNFTQLWNFSESNLVQINF